MPSSGWARDLSFAWQEPLNFGAMPETRYGHTLTSLHSVLSSAGGEAAGSAPASLRSRTVVMFGGSAWPTKQNDVHLVTLSRSAEGLYTATWSTPTISSRPAPSPRERHAALLAPAWNATHTDTMCGSSVPGAIIVFGGFGEGYQDDDEDDDHIEENDEVVGEEEEEVDEEEENEEENEEEEEEEVRDEELEDADEEWEEAMAVIRSEAKSWTDVLSAHRARLEEIKKGGGDGEKPPSAAPPPPIPKPQAFPIQRSQLHAVDSRAWALHLSIEALPSFADYSTLPPAHEPLPSCLMDLPLQRRTELVNLAKQSATPFRSSATWRRIPVGVLDSGPLPVPPLPSSTLARDFLALVPGARALAAASLRAPLGCEEREEMIEDAVRASLLGAAAAFNPSLRHADFALRVGPHALPTHSWLLRAASPMLHAVVAECEAASLGGGSPRSRSLQMALWRAAAGAKGGEGGRRAALPRAR